MTIKTETLEQKLNRLIAEADGIQPEQVTVQYIHEQREKHIYPTARYAEPGLISYTREELDLIGAKVDEIMSGICHNRDLL